MMLARRRPFLYCASLLCLPMILYLWIHAPLDSVGHSVVEPSATATPIVETRPTVVPGAAPDFQAEPMDSVSLPEIVTQPLFLRTLLKWAKRLQPKQGGTILLAMIVTVLVAANFRTPVCWRNMDILLLLAPSLFLIDLVPLGNTPEDPTQTALFRLLFLGLFLVTAVLLSRALARAFGQEEGCWRPNLPTPAVAGLTVLLLVLSTFLALVRAPDDAGYYSNIGAYRMLQTGRFPYGDPVLRGGAAATYGPVLYVAHMPFQLSISRIMAVIDPDEVSFVHRLAGTDPQHDGPPVLATKLAVLLFHSAGVAGLVLVGQRLAGPGVGWGLACLYASSAYVLGLGGEDYYITGMTYISHIAPAALTILAFAALSRPVLAGGLLGVAAGALYYPAFLFPLWLGYYFWQRKKWQEFAVGFLVVCAVILSLVLLMTEPAEGQSVLRVVYESTLGHQEAKDAYGSSTFSFWGAYPQLAAFWQEPFVNGWYLLRPSFLLFALLVGASFFMARGRTISQFAFLTAAVVIATQLWKSHAGGTYVEWYYPFFLIGLLAQQRSDAANQFPQRTFD